MTFWNAVDAEPKRKYQWEGIVSLNYVKDGKVSEGKGRLFDDKIVPFTIRSWSAPVFQVNTEKMPSTWGKRDAIAPKSFDWEDIEIVAYDLTSTSANNSRMLYKWLIKLGYDSTNLASRRAMFTNLTALQTAGEIAMLVLTRLNNAGERVEQFKFQGSYLKSFNFGDSSYDSDELNTVTMKFGIRDVSYRSAVTAESAMRDMFGSAGTMGSPFL